LPFINSQASSLSGKKSRNRKFSKTSKKELPNLKKDQWNQQRNKLKRKHEKGAKEH
jgi:hypothetical protein